MTGKHNSNDVNENNNKMTNQAAPNKKLVPVITEIKPLTAKWKNLDAASKKLMLLLKAIGSRLKNWSKKLSKQSRSLLCLVLKQVVSCKQKQTQTHQQRLQGQGATWPLFPDATIGM
jgi:hypothetical protein